MSPKVKRLLIVAALGLFVLLIVGFVMGAIGAKFFGSDKILQKPAVHLPAQAVFPAEERENASNGENLKSSKFAITNTMLSSWITTVVLIAIFVIGASRKRLIPGRLQGLAEMVVEGFLNFIEGVAGRDLAKKFLPVIATIFLFVLLNAWIGLIPIYQSLGFDPPKVHRVVEEEGDALASKETAVIVNGGNFDLPTSEGEKRAVLAQLQPFIDDDRVSCNDLTCEVETGEKVKFSKGAGEKANVSTVILRGRDIDLPHSGDARREVLEQLGPAMKEGLVTCDGLACRVKTAGAVIITKGEDHSSRVDLLRPAGTDLNMPLALAIVAFVFVEFWGLRRVGFRYMGKFMRFGNLLHGRIFIGLIDLFVGMLEGLSEFIRVVSFTFRLFGNMLAGKILLLVSAFLVPFVFSIPFYGLEILVGFVQALIFAGLTLTFAAVAVAHHEEAPTTERVQHAER